MGNVTAKVPPGFKAHYDIRSDTDTQEAPQSSTGPAPLVELISKMGEARVIQTRRAFRSAECKPPESLHLT